MQAGEGGGEAFVVAAEAAAAGGLGEGAFDDPAAGQKSEAAFGLGQFDDKQVHAGNGRLGGGFRSNVTLST